MADWPSHLMQSPAYPSAPTRRNVGFTLIEMLAALVISGLVLGIIGSGVIQALRLGELGERVASNANAATLPQNWFRETVSMSATVGRLAEKSLSGDAQGFTGFSVRGIDGRRTGLQAYAWKARFDPSRGTTTLLYTSADAAEVRVHEWEGSVARFRYLSRDHRWHDQWPPARLAVPADFKLLPLPLAVAATVGEHEWLVALADQTPALPTLKELLQ